MPKRHFYLLATQVLYEKGGIERTRNFNVLYPSEQPHVSRKALGLVQQQAQVRFFSEFDTDRETNVRDVFILSVSNLGEMTDEEFLDESDELPEEEEAEAEAPKNDD